MTEQTQTPILRAEHLVYEYGAGTPFLRRAVDDVSFLLYPGRITGIIGHTGSGKSTLVQMLNGLLVPMSGKVFYKEKDILTDKKALRDLRFHIGLVFQYPEYQLFEETVGKDVAYGPVNMGLSSEEVADRVNQSLAFVGLPADIAEKSPFDLSGGQKRRAAIAGVMAMQPDVLILDEPASGLDPAGRTAIFGGLMRYRDATGAAMVIISHSMEDMAAYADDILVMSGARLVAAGTKEEIFQNPSLLRESGLDLPEITRFAERLTALGLPLPSGLYTVEALTAALLSLKDGQKND